MSDSSSRFSLRVGPAIPDLAIPRGNPCAAWTGPEATCGATPASLYHRTCGVISHGADIWLCPVHAGLAGSGMATCRLCAERGGRVRARIIRIATEPVRLPRRYP